MNNYHYSKNIVTDQAGNIFVPVLDYKHPIQPFNISDTNGQALQIQKEGIAKLNPDGKLKWLAEIKRDPPNPGKDYTKISLVASKVTKGKILVAGLTDLPLYLDSFTIPGVKNQMLENVFIATCDSNGKWLSAKVIAFETSLVSSRINIEEDISGNMLISLLYYDVLVIDSVNKFNSKTGTHTPWIGKFDADGKFLWGKDLITEEPSLSPPNIVSDKNENIIIAGSVRSKINPNIIYGRMNTYIYKFSPNGDFIKKNKIYGGELFDNYEQSIPIDSLGDIYLTGSFPDSINFGKIKFTTNGSVFVAKFDNSLNLIWAKKSAGKILARCTSAALDESSNLFITGLFCRNISMDSIKLIDPIKYDSGTTNIFIFKISSDGITKWGSSPKNFFSSGKQIISDNCGNIITTGIFSGYPGNSNATFPKNAIIQFDNIIANSKNFQDYYLAKLCQAKIKQKVYCGLDSLEIICDQIYSTFKWEFENGKILTGKKISHVADSTGWYKVKLTATSTKGCIQHTEDSFYFALPVTQKDDPELFYATVNSPSSAKIEFKNIPTAENYHIYRSNSGSNFQKIASTSNAFFEDNTTDCNKHSYTYKVTAEDRCGNIVNSSNLAKTILLQGENHKNQFAFLNWSPYEVWQQGVKEYCIETKDSSGEWKALICSQSTKMEDPAFVEEGQTERCYRIRASENNGNNHYSISNELCLAYIPTIWIPNAFSPNGDKLNDTFKILTLGISEFKLTIYNRWGEEVFITDNIKNSWNGKTGNEKLPEGEYLYILKAKGINKENIYKSGSVLLMR